MNIVNFNRSYNLNMNKMTSISTSTPKLLWHTNGLVITHQNGSSVQVNWDWNVKVLVLSTED